MGIGSWVLLLYFCNPHLAVQCSYHVFGTWENQAQCQADMVRLPISRVIRAHQCMEVEAPGLIFTAPG